MIEPLAQLADLGLPSGFVGMVLIAIIFAKIHKKVSVTAAMMAVFLVGVYGITQLIQAWSGEDLTVSVSPARVLAFDSTGQVSLDIVVYRGDTVVTTSSIAQPSDDNFDNSLRNIGWKPAVECLAPTTTPSLWSTNRVYAGQTLEIGQTDFGLLRIDARQFTGEGEAIITLQLLGSDPPIPDQLEIKNKGLGVQSFLGLPEFFVAVREANFQASPPWAAFTIFTR